MSRAHYYAWCEHCGCRTIHRWSQEGRRWVSRCTGCDCRSSDKATEAYEEIMAYTEGR